MELSLFKLMEIIYPLIKIGNKKLFLTENFPSLGYGLLSAL